jgi:hypothetical protein
MRNILPIFLLVLLAATVNAQETPRFKKYPIAESGMYVYMPADPGEFEVTESEDKSQVYTGEIELNEFNFAVIAVKFSEPMESTKEELEELLISYMDFLQGQFGIHTLDSDDSVTGVLDYWEDEDGLSWVVKGWVNKEYLAVLAVYGKGEYPHYTVQDLFLHGIRFSAE